MLAFPVTATIQPTASRNERSVLFRRNFDATLPHDGELIVTEWAGKRVVRTITTKYHVREVPAIGVCGRRFECCLMSCTGLEGTARGKATEQRISSVYTTVVKADGSGACNCPAGEIGRAECVHVKALRELIETGGLEHPLDYLPPSPQEDIADEILDAEFAKYGVREEDRPFPPDACHYAPGSEKRLAVMAERARNGFKLWHPNDCPF